jgi:hypothetical protein
MSTHYQMEPEDQQIKSQTIKEDVNNPGLLSKTEIQWLIDNVKVSKSSFKII